MDYGGAALLIDAAKQAGVRRYVIVSAMGAADPPQGDETFAVYLRAKARADDELRASGLDFTVVRPGGLTDDPPRAGWRSRSDCRAARSRARTSPPCCSASSTTTRPPARRSTW